MDGGWPGKPQSPIAIQISRPRRRPEPVAAFPTRSPRAAAAALATECTRMVAILICAPVTASCSRRQVLLNASDADLIAIPTNTAKLPAATGSVGVPVAFYPATQASPISEGAVS